MSDRMDVNRLLMEMRAMKSQAFQPNHVGDAGEISGRGPNAIKNANGPQFTDLFSQAINKVNEVQQASGATAKAYIQGDPTVDVTDVMIASQKSSVAFDAAVQVRNKVVEAYKDIMNMPI